MVQIAGKYEFIKNEGMVEYLKAMGIPDDRAKPLLEDKPTLAITVTGNVVKLASTGINNKTYEYELNKPVEESLYEIPVTTVATLNDATLQITSTQKDGSDTFVRTYVFSDSGVVVALSGSKTGSVTGSRHYKRV